MLRSWTCISPCCSFTSSPPLLPRGGKASNTQAEGKWILGKQLPGRFSSFSSSSSAGQQSCKAWEVSMGMLWAAREFVFFWQEVLFWGQIILWVFCFCSVQKAFASSAQENPQQWIFAIVILFVAIAAAWTESEEFLIHYWKVARSWTRGIKGHEEFRTV